MTLILSESDIEQVVSMEDCIPILEATFRDFALGAAVNRPRSHTYVPVSDKEFYLFKSMDGGVPRFGVHALRIASQVSVDEVVEGRRRQGKPPRARNDRFVGLVLLFDMETTEPIGILQDAGVQRLRVGATSAIAAAALSRADSTRVGLFGTGWQAYSQLDALSRVRDLELIRVFSPRPAKRAAFVAEVTDRLGLRIEATDDPRQVVEGADIIACATNSAEPVFDGAWLVEGQHVNSLQGGELDRLTHERADVICVRSREPSTHHVQEDASTKPIAMELSTAYKTGFEPKMIELGRLLIGEAVGRTDDRQITLFGGGGTGGSSGLGIQFAGISKLAIDRARERGIGTEIPTELFLQEHHT
jgi:alanine dehydrogenase